MHDFCSSESVSLLLIPHNPVLHKLAVSPSYDELAGVGNHVFDNLGGDRGGTNISIMHWNIHLE